MTTLFDRELVPYEEAAAALGIEPKRLLGFMLRQPARSLAEPHSR